MSVKIRPFRYGNNYKTNNIANYLSKLKSERFGMEIGWYGGSQSSNNTLKSDRFGMEILY